MSAIIPAAGRGERMGNSVSKQFIKVKGIPILAYTIRIFEELKEINEIFLIIPPLEMELYLKEIIEKYNFKKVLKLIPGGSRRQDSVYNGLKEIREDTDIVVIHDAVRPFTDKDIIKESIDSAYMFGGAAAGVEVKDTVKMGSEDGFIYKTLDRSRLIFIQTPQAFKREILTKAYSMAYIDNIKGTDDASFVERLGYKIKIIKGSYKNIKITTPDDLIIAENFLEI